MRCRPGQWRVAAGLGPLVLIFAVLTAPAIARDLVQADPLAVQIARLHYGGGGDWYGNPSSLPNLLRTLHQRTGLTTAATEAVVTLDGEDLYRYPLIYATGHGRIALTPPELDDLRRYLDAGGMFWADDNYGFDQSFRETVAQLYPDLELRPIGSDHPIFRSFYRLEGLPKIHQHDGDPAQAFGVQKDGRLVIFYTWSSDIGDGLEDPEVHGDPAPVREAAAQMAVNVMMYALTRP